MVLLLPQVSYFIRNYLSARSVTAGKFDKSLHFLSTFIARNFTIGLIIRYVSLNIVEENYYS
jgi:hypothetical protein